MTSHAHGEFDVILTSQEQDGPPNASPVGRLMIDKQFHGELEGASAGQMLAVNTDIPGSAGYVAMAWVTGMLHGRSGAFALQHSGTMTRGAPQLSVTVVPDSATGELVGLAGEMAIDITDGKHLYDFGYTLAEQG
jgi:hypothetical protein